MIKSFMKHGVTLIVEIHFRFLVISWAGGLNCGETCVVALGLGTCKRTGNKHKRRFPRDN